MESLVQDLAGAAANSTGKDELRSKCINSLTLTPEQALLSIPPSLVYLAGLVLSNDTDFLSLQNSPNSNKSETAPRLVSLPDSVHVRFQKYCRRYNQFLSTPGSVSLPDFRVLSPRIMPTLEQYCVIQKDTASKAAFVALQKLLIDGDDPKQNKGKESLPRHHRHSAKTKKKKIRQKPTHHNNQRSYWLEDENSSMAGNTCKEEDTKPLPESLDDIRGKFLTHSSMEENSSALSISTEWISVPKITRTITRKTKPFSPESTIQKDPRKPASRGQGEEFPPLTGGPTSVAECSKKGLTKNSLCSAAASTSVAASIIEEVRVQPQNVHLITSSTDEYNDIKNTSSCDKGRMVTPVPVSTEQKFPPVTIMTSSPLKNHCRIRELEDALAESNRLLEEERRTHTQQWKEEQERHANSMQALQLRLYISETRLKTYQEALEAHIQSVGENVYNPNSLSSPVRRTCQEQSSHQATATRSGLPETPSSPLVSRVFPHSNRLDGSTKE